jgi:hypothetical protein
MKLKINSRRVEAAAYAVLLLRIGAMLGMAYCWPQFYRPAP